jgi:hypothetical protein
MKPLNYDVEARKSRQQYYQENEWTCQPIGGVSLTEKGEFHINNSGANAPDWRDAMAVHFGLWVSKPKDMPRRVVTDTGEHVKDAWFDTDQWLMYDREHNRVVSTRGGIRYKYTTEPPVPSKKIATHRPDRAAFKAKWTSEAVVELREMCKTLMLLEPEAYQDIHRWSGVQYEPNIEVMLTLMDHPDLLDTTNREHKRVVSLVTRPAFEAYVKKATRDRRTYNYLQLEF